MKKIGLSASVAAPVHFPSVPQLARHESVDTLDIVAVVTELMEAFDVELGVDDLTPENFNSVEAIEELIESKQS